MPDPTPQADDLTTTLERWHQLTGARPQRLEP